MISDRLTNLNPRGRYIAAGAISPGSIEEKATRQKPKKIPLRPRTFSKSSIKACNCCREFLVVKHPPINEYMCQVAKPEEILAIGDRKKRCSNSMHFLRRRLWRRRKLTPYLLIEEVATMPKIRLSEEMVKFGRILEKKPYCFQNIVNRTKKSGRDPFLHFKSHAKRGQLFLVVPPSGTGKC